MKNATELQLRKFALVLTALVVLQLLWAGIRLLVLAEPEAIVPAESSLQAGGLLYGAQQGEGLSEDLVVRPVFWKGRTAYVPDQPEEPEPEPINNSGSSAINKVRLLGVYTADTDSGVIIAYNGERSRLLLDESIGDWTLTMLSADGAVFESGEDIRTLQLEHAAPAAGKSKARKKAGRTSANNNADAKKKQKQTRGADKKLSKSADEQHDKTGD